MLFLVLQICVNLNLSPKKESLKKFFLRSKILDDNINISRTGEIKCSMIQVAFGLKIKLFFFFNDILVCLHSFYVCMYVWLCWVFVSVRGLSLVVASGGHSSSRCGGHSSSRCAGLSLSRPLLLRSTGSRRAGSVVVAHGPSCSLARGIFPDQGSNPRPPHWQADSQPLHRHQGSPED